jgi:hypothetical protein
VLADLMHGRSYVVSGGLPDSDIAVSGDKHGTAIEVYPEDIRLRPDGRNAVCHERAVAEDGCVAFQMLLSVPSDRATIERIGAREGWTTRFRPRGAPKQKPLCNVIEFWVGNRIMLELAPHDMIGDYEQLLQFDRFDKVPAPA